MVTYYAEYLRILERILSVIFLTECIPQQFSDVLHDCNLIS